MIQKASEEQRVVLTADKVLLHARYSDHVYVLRAQTKKEQLAEVVRAFRLDLDAGTIMTRCNECGGTLVDRIFGPHDLPDPSCVPSGVLRDYTEFWVCSVCGKVFWQGKQYESAMTHLCQRIENMKAG
jgi:uncharacterized protein